MNASLGVWAVPHQGQHGECIALLVQNICGFSVLCYALCAYVFLSLLSKSQDLRVNISLFYGSPCEVKEFGFYSQTYTLLPVSINFCPSE